jgi:hypothetical protein
MTLRSPSTITAPTVTKTHSNHRFATFRELFNEELNKKVMMGIDDDDEEGRELHLHVCAIERCFRFLAVGYR